ncbi:hypothetical protein DPX16_17902 [Anabarilius grahami]|uniref:Uncharacterized protein n=1 Tax=Anabarilius grahami TaxID=495550 RepID=A0A3N0YHF0_ANAGA|nr:hypothetical protein DPX16_17902 [Anabarilius grahami]
MRPNPEARDAISFGCDPFDDDVLSTAASDSEELVGDCSSSLPLSGQEKRTSPSYNELLEVVTRAVDKLGLEWDSEPKQNQAQSHESLPNPAPSVLGWALPTSIISDTPEMFGVRGEFLGSRTHGPFMTALKNPTADMGDTGGFLQSGNVLIARVQQAPKIEQPTPLVEYWAVWQCLPEISQWVTRTIQHDFFFRQGSSLDGVSLGGPGFEAGDCVTLRPHTHWKFQE